MTAFYESLLFQVKVDPIKYLGRHDVRLIYPYCTGYNFARRDWGFPSLDRMIDLDKFRAWQSSKVRLSSQNLQSFCRLLTDTEEEAFELFFILYDSALKENGIATPIAAFESEQVDPASISKKGSILALITDTAFRKRPAMYFGNDNWIQSLWTICNGYIQAEADLGVPDSEDAEKLRAFQLWVDERHPIGKGRNWGQLYSFLALESDQGALDSFFEDMEMFLAGESSSTPARWITEAVANVLKNQKA